LPQDVRKFGLIGRSLGHSFSREFFTAKFAAEGAEASYSNIELAEMGGIRAVLDSGEWSGLNVTFPYKTAVISFLDELSQEAREIGAVNTIAFRNGRTIGHNTDAFGFAQSIKPFLTNRHERALLIGTGGASKAVAYVFRNLGIDVLHVSRNPQGLKEFPYEAVNEHMLRACKVVVNCTPVGTFPDVNQSVPFPFHFLTDEHLVIDLIYNPEKTAFLRLSEENGAAILNGASMLKEQALKAWEIWNREA
jgi:shikimate dehydrogenase